MGVPPGTSVQRYNSERGSQRQEWDNNLQIHSTWRTPPFLFSKRHCSPLPPAPVSSVLPSFPLCMLTAPLLATRVPTVASTPVNKEAPSSPPVSAKVYVQATELAYCSQLSTFILHSILVPLFMEGLPCSKHYVSQGTERTDHGPCETNGEN